MWSSPVKYDMALQISFIAVKTIWNFLVSVLQAIPWNILQSFSFVDFCFGCSHYWRKHSKLSYWWMRMKRRWLWWCWWWWWCWWCWWWWWWRRLVLIALQLTAGRKRDQSSHTSLYSNVLVKCQKHCHHRQNVKIRHLLSQNSRFRTVSQRKWQICAVSRLQILSFSAALIFLKAKLSKEMKWGNVGEERIGWFWWGGGRPEC